MSAGNARALLALTMALGCGHPPWRYTPPDYANDAGAPPDTPAPPRPEPRSVAITCPLPIEHAGVVLARVGDRVLTVCDLALAWEERTREGYAVYDLREVLRGLVDEALRAATVTVPPRDRAVDGVLADAVIRADTLAALARERPDDDAITRFYNAHRDDFTVPERVHLREVVLPTRVAALAVVRDLAAGVPFEQLVAQTIDVAGRRDGGDLGFIPRVGVSGVAQSVVNAGFTLTEPGALTREPLRVVTEVAARRHTRRVTAWHVVQLLQRLPREEIPLEDARRRILHRMTRDRYVTLRREVRARWAETLRRAVHDAVDERALRKVHVAPR